jgi:hypothetical protein
VEGATLAPALARPPRGAIGALGEVASALSKGVRFCAPLHVFKGLGLFFCNFKTAKYTFTMFYAVLRSGRVARAAIAVPDDLSMTIASSLDAIDCISPSASLSEESCLPEIVGESPDFRLLCGWIW